MNEVEKLASQINAKIDRAVANKRKQDRTMKVWKEALEYCAACARPSIVQEVAKKALENKMIDNYPLTYKEKIEFGDFLLNGTRTYAERRSEGDYETMPFGKYKGTPTKEVPLYYLRFLLSNVTTDPCPLRNVLLRAVEHQLEKKAKDTEKYWARQKFIEECKVARKTLGKFYGKNQWIFLDELPRH